MRRAWQTESGILGFELIMISICLVTRGAMQYSTRLRKDVSAAAFVPPIAWRRRWVCKQQTEYEGASRLLDAEVAHADRSDETLLHKGLRA